MARDMQSCVHSSCGGYSGTARRKQEQQGASIDLIILLVTTICDWYDHQFIMIDVQFDVHNGSIIGYARSYIA